LGEIINYNKWLNLLLFMIIKRLEASRASEDHGKGAKVEGSAFFSK
jgi:hypothetical protein